MALPSHLFHRFWLVFEVDYDLHYDEEEVDQGQDVANLRARRGWATISTIDIRATFHTSSRGPSCVQARAAISHPALAVPWPPASPASTHLAHDLALVEGDLDELVQDGVEHGDTKPSGGQGGEAEVQELNGQDLRGVGVRVEGGVLGAHGQAREEREALSICGNQDGSDTQGPKSTLEGTALRPQPRRRTILRMKVWWLSVQMRDQLERV